MNHRSFQPESFELEAAYLQAMAHPVRLYLLHFLASGPKCNCEIVPSLGLDHSTISRHLNTLKRAGILSSYKEGVKVMFHIQDERVLALMETVSAMVAKGMREELTKLETKIRR